MLDEKPGVMLIEESKSLKRYNYKLVTNLMQQIDNVNKLINQIKEKGTLSQETSLNYAFLNFYKHRCQKIIDVYFLSRLLMANIKNSYLLNTDEYVTWEKLESAKNEYLNKYAMLNFSEVNEPPEKIYVYVICLKYCGLVYDDQNLIEMSKDRIYFVKKKSIDYLLEEKSVQIINKYQ